MSFLPRQATTDQDPRNEARLELHRPAMDAQGPQQGFVEAGQGQRHPAEGQGLAQAMGQPGL